ncbi:MAG TPA: glycosyltransferase [Thermoanaerobaculia bacterium]|nr:glycosyltransferase [Thermoanaerobaculia bacterium]
MRIVHLIWTITGGGAERQLAGLAPELARRGAEVHVAYVHQGLGPQLRRWDGCAVTQIAPAVKYDLTLLPRVLLFARRLRPDVIQTWLAHMDVIGGTAAALLRIPWVMSERSAAAAYPPAPLTSARVCLARRAEVIVANSQGGADYWRQHGIPSSRLEIVANFVPEINLGSVALLHDARVSAGDELIVHLGRLSAEKNLETLIAAMALLRCRRPQVKLVLCGDGTLRRPLEEAVRAAGLEERVVFAGFVADVGPWLKRADALVAVSRFEGHPNSVLEAIAHGVPLVLSDIPAYRAMLGDDAAVFVPLTNAEALAGAIAATLEARACAQQRAARARAAPAALSLEAMATRYEQVYRRVMRSA